MKKYPKVRRPGHSKTQGLFADPDHQLIITEKFDGNNFRVCRSDDGLQFGSRNTILGSDPTEIGGMFDAVSDYIADQICYEDIYEIEHRLCEEWSLSEDPSVVLFGENAVQHTISEYSWEDVPQFQLFDIWWECEDESGWLEWDFVEMFADVIGFETLPVVKRTTVDAFDIENFEVPDSAYRIDDGPAEGVVIRNPATGTKAKFISDEFAERHRSAKSSDMVDPDDDNAMFVHKHVTERRIEKNVQKLIEEPGTGYDDVEMEMMEDLHETVWRDVWEEDLEEIIFEDYVLDLDRAHNSTANKAANYLRKLLQSNKNPVAVVDTKRGETVGVDG